jgi:hypothetical protein
MHVAVSRTPETAALFVPRQRTLDTSGRGQKLAVPRGPAPRTGRRLRQLPGQLFADGRRYLSAEAVFRFAQRRVFLATKGDQMPLAYGAATPPTSTVSALRCWAPATASGFA